MKSSVSSKKTVVDPVCGMAVDPCNSEMTAEYEDEIFYFCDQGCLRTFEKNPAKFKNVTSGKKKGIWGRYLDRLNKSTDGKAMKCH